MSNFKMWYSANAQLLRKTENRKIAPMLEFGSQMIGKRQGIREQISELRGITWFVRASQAAAKKVERGDVGYGLVAECDAIIEKLDKHFKGNEIYSRIFEAAYQTRAELRASLHNEEGAAEDSAKAEEFGKIAKKREEIGKLHSAAYLKFEKKDYAGMLEDYRKVIEIAQEKAYFYLHKRGFVKYLMEDYAGAAAECTASIELNPGYAKAYQERGRAKYMLGDRSAIADCDKARELDPEGYYPYPHLSPFLTKREDCDRAISFDPGNPELYIRRGRNKDGWGSQKDLAGAVEDFTKAIELLKGKPETLENLKMLKEALWGRSSAKRERSEVSGFFYVSNHSGWKEDETDAMALGQRIDGMERQAKKEKKLAQATA